MSAKIELKFKHQQFQIDACNAVCDIFAGQPKSKPTRYILDPGKDVKNTQTSFEQDAFANSPLLILEREVWDNIHKKQIALGLKPSGKVGDDINLTIEMETGTGKTYTYIKTIYELNHLYGWTKFIIVVPSVAIREGVKKSFENTRKHFQQEYHKSIMEFVYNSQNLNEIETFATDSKIRVMIINSQAFAASLKEDGKSKESRIIFSEQESFKWRKPIDVIAKTNPILILDEPQSLGRTADAVTQKAIKRFNPLFRISYSATPPELNKNIIYRLDAQDAYNKKLVKKIAVKGISVVGDSATGGYAYLAGINVSANKNPTARLEFDYRGKSGIVKKIKNCDEGDNLYDLSGQLDEYRYGWLITHIDGRSNSVTFQNGTELFAGDVVGSTTEEQLRRIQIRETIQSHFEREQVLLESGIKVLSLFFIDEVANYRLSNDAGEANGIYAKIFEEEYNNIKESYLAELDFNPNYRKFIENTDATKCHKGYFSIDKKSKKFKDSEEKRNAVGSDDVDAYDLIMKNKEQLLNLSEPVRFLFSHSALREGWDNPNVFQICPLKQSYNNTSRRQEIGRGLRLSVNQNGERMDESVLGDDVQEVNQLTVIASESYEDFVSNLQTDIADAMHDRPRSISAELFENRTIDGQLVDKEKSQDIYESLIANGYVKRGKLTEQYHNDVEAGTFKPIEGFDSAEIIKVIETIYKPVKIDNARNQVVEVKLNDKKLHQQEFQDLWNKINVKSTYRVVFDSDELIKKAIYALDEKLYVSKTVAVIRTGQMDELDKQQAEKGEAFGFTSERREAIQVGKYTSVKYDLLDKLVQLTGLTRKTLAQIMSGIKESRFKLFEANPEEFITRAANIINEQKATAIVEEIKYDRITETYDMNVFTEPKLKGSLENTVPTPNKHIYSHVIADSSVKTEKNMANSLEHAEEVAVYAKLPRGFYISTPVGKYNPDWAIAFNKGSVKHIYFVAETKGNMENLELELRGVEKSKIACARKHFAAISSDSVKYEVVETYEDLMKVVGE